MELGLTLTSAYFATCKSLAGQTQLLQQKLFKNRKTIDEQSQELTERGQQLITVRLEKRNNQWWHAIARRRDAGKDM